MKIILRKNVAKLGTAQDIVEVANGYANNFLIPRGLAEMATDANRKRLQEQAKQAKHKDKKLTEEAVRRGEKLQTLKIVLSLQTGEKGHIFGSITEAQIATAIKNADLTMQIESPREQIKILNPIETIGTHEIALQLYKDVSVNLNIEVVSANA
ncbi:MAG: 50S ribosomal protein L9 [Bacteroidota bacterium]